MESWKAIKANLGRSGLIQSRGILFSAFSSVSISNSTHVCACIVSRVWLFVTWSTIVCQAPLSTEFSKQEYWRRLPFSTLTCWLRDQTYVSCVSCLGRQILYHCVTWEACSVIYLIQFLFLIVFVFNGNARVLLIRRERDEKQLMKEIYIYIFCSWKLVTQTWLWSEALAIDLCSVGIKFY